MKLLKEENEKLMKKKETVQETYRYRQDRDHQKELNTVRSNVNVILGQPTRQRQTEKQNGQDMDIL